MVFLWEGLAPLLLQGARGPLISTLRVSVSGLNWFSSDGVLRGGVGVRRISGVGAEAAALAAPLTVPLARIPLCLFLLFFLLHLPFGQFWRCSPRWGHPGAPARPPMQPSRSFPRPRFVLRRPSHRCRRPSSAHGPPPPAAGDPRSLSPWLPAAPIPEKGHASPWQLQRRNQRLRPGAAGGADCRCSACVAQPLCLTWSCAKGEILNTWADTHLPLLCLFKCYLLSATFLSSEFNFVHPPWPFNPSCPKKLAYQSRSQ